MAYLLSAIDDFVGIAASRSTSRQPQRWPLAARCALAFIGCGVLAAQAQDSWRDQLDQTISNLVVSRRSPAAIRAARRVSAAAEPAVAFLPIAVCAVAGLLQGDRRSSWVPGLTVITGMAARRRLAQVVARPRPPETIWMAEPEGFSLPSKHTSLAVLTAGACANAVGAGPLLSNGAAITAGAAVGGSRICLGVHWATDVLAAWLFAAGWLALAELATADPRPRRRQRAPFRLRRGDSR